MDHDWKDAADRDAYWRERLSAETYAITRRAATERAFSGRYCDEKRSGTYVCVCCGASLFASDAKFDSGTGWPSFAEPLAKTCVTERTDTSFGMVRTEVLCQACDAHLGHVFPDGPPPTGQRYCLNSAALVLHPSDGAPPDQPS